MTRKEPAKALARVRTQLHTAPQESLLYNLLGSIYLAQHNDTEAESAFKKAIALNENVLVSYFNLAGLYAKNRAYAQAVQQYETVLKTHPNLLLPYMLLGMLYDLQNKPPQAMAYYEKALALNPRFAPAANNLAWNYAEHGGNIDRALSLAQTAREQLPHDPSIADTLGWLYYKKDRYRQALPLFKESAEKLTDNPVVHYHLGMAYYKIGDTNLAKGALQRALQLRRDFPGAEEAQQVLAQIS
jgi:tetratricopeptide (TPR) repeat protein